MGAGAPRGGRGGRRSAHGARRETGRWLTPGVIGWSTSRSKRGCPGRTPRSWIPAHPGDLDAEQALGFASGRAIVCEIAPPAAIQEAIDRRYAPDRLLERMIDRVGAKLVDDVRVVEDAAPEAVGSHEVESAPVVKLANLILHDAVSEGASDIHLEPGRDGGTV